MNKEQSLDSLGRLLDLREREMDRLSADMTARQATRNRFIDNLARLEQLCESTGASGAQMTPDPKSVQTVAPRGDAQGARYLSPYLSLNCGSYKQAVMKMAAAHRVDLALHEADTAVAKQVLMVAARRHEALDQELTRQRRDVVRLQNVREQKRQDDMALQIWRRVRK